MNKETYNNVSTGERIARVLAGFALIYSVALQPGVIGMAAILPLIAVYPILTGVLGWDPVYQLVSRLQRRQSKPSSTGEVVTSKM